MPRGWHTICRRVILRWSVMGELIKNLSEIAIKVNSIMKITIVRVMKVTIMPITAGWWPNNRGRSSCQSPTKPASLLPTTPFKTRNHTSTKKTSTLFTTMITTVTIILKTINIITSITNNNSNNTLLNFKESFSSTKESLKTTCQLLKNLRKKFFSFWRMLYSSKIKRNYCLANCVSMKIRWMR